MYRRRDGANTASRKNRGMISTRLVRVVRPISGPFPPGKGRKPWGGADPAGEVRLGTQIELTDWAIDRLVYDLYGLTEEEIRVVEG